MSAILSADALNDFIGPSIECIKPVETLPPPPNPLEISVETDKTGPSDAKTAAQISLTDCLACSGCVTSSEAVLVQLQSHVEVLDSLERWGGKEGSKKFVALVSPQTRAALAVGLECGEREVGWMIEQLLLNGGEGMGKDAGKAFDLVLDTNPFRRISLHYAAEEVVEALSEQHTGPEPEDQKKPILTSSCPGFICYIESTHPQLIPHLSRMKSPQAIAGTFIKSLLIGQGLASSPEDIYIVSIMPCFDKKLEGARGELTSKSWFPGTKSLGDFGAETEAVRDIDCVITTRELLSLAEARGINFRDLAKTPQTQPLLAEITPEIQNFLTQSTPNGLPESGTSGGNLVYVLSTLLARNPEATLQIQPGRNVDTLDYILLPPPAASGLENENQTPIAKLSRCYGFRNIQNLVRKLKPSRAARSLPQFGGSRKPGAAIASASPAAARRVAAKRATATSDAKATYVEVMACPGGCTNGGGQLKYTDETVWTELGLPAPPTSQRELLGRVDEAYFSGDEEGEQVVAKMEKPSEDRWGHLRSEAQKVESVVGEWERVSRLGRQGRQGLLKTNYRKVANDLGGKLGEAEVLEMASRGGGGW